MPRVKIDYIVSFSSEDPEHPASNLLSLEINKKKWLCKSGETSCSVVFQLPKAVEISSVQIGGSQVALVEVLVGRSETPADPFQVLVPSSVFLSPTESRRGAGAASERVRTFASEQLAARGKFDRVRVVCSQPYNKHCKFGLSFIHIYEPESLDKTSRTPEVTASDSVPLTLSTSKPAINSSFMFESEGEEDFRPGELFAKHLQKASNTDAQIRRASSHALKNISDSSTKLTKSPINKHNNNSRCNNDAPTTSRQRDDLMYTRDDEQPHAKIDRIVNRHKDEKSKENDSKTDEKRDKKYKDSQRKEQSDDVKEAHKNEDKRNSEVRNGDATRAKKRDEASSSQRNDRDTKKRRHSEEKRDSGLVPGPVSATPERLLSHVTFALSGYENPRRAALRSAACALGARYLRDWNPSCTHVICAFPNTPKLRAVRSSGASCVAVTGAWVDECFSSRRLLPEPWFATETQFRVKRPADLKIDDDEEGDTDEEIEKVLQKNKKQKTDRSPTRRDNSSTRRESPTRSDKLPIRSDRSPQRRDRSSVRSDKSPTSRDRSPVRSDISPKRHDRSPKRRDTPPARGDKSSSHSTRSPSHSREKNTPKKDEKPPTSVKSPDCDSDRTISPAHDTSADSDVAFVMDERIQGNVSVPSDSDTAPDSPPDAPRAAPDATLPELFRDVTFRVHVASPHDVALIERYIRAYGGLVMHESQLDEDSEVDYIICTEVPPRARRCVAALPPAWLWRCHKDKLLVDVEQYKLN